jgi:MoxR-like ATPase
MAVGKQEPKPATAQQRHPGVDSLDAAALSQKIKSFQADFEKIRAEVGKSIVGMNDQVEKVVVALIAGGNVLLEGVPGLGKTMLVRALSETLQLDFRRVQFTPDLMPADIIGTNIVDEDANGTRQLRFQPGPLFTNLLLADEINRSTPKTQSALLEAMEEHTVSVGRITHTLQEPFFVMATQNPIEQAGTYPLPAAQLDKFLFKLLVDYPSGKELDGILTRTTSEKPPVLSRVTTGEKLLEMRDIARCVPVAAHVKRYAALLVLATDPDSEHATEMTHRTIRIGASPRGVLGMLAAARVKALLSGRHQVSIDDIRDAALPVLRHRITRSFEAENEGLTCDDIIRNLVKTVSEESEAAFATAGAPAAAPKKGA